MSTEPQIADLERQHQDLEGQLDEAMSHPGTDSLHIAELKRQKLQLKDRITQLKESNAVH